MKIISFFLLIFVASCIDQSKTFFSKLQERLVTTVTIEGHSKDWETNPGIDGSRVWLYRFDLINEKSLCLFYDQKMLELNQCDSKELSSPIAFMDGVQRLRINYVAEKGLRIRYQFKDKEISYFLFVPNLTKSRFWYRDQKYPEDNYKRYDGHYAGSIWPGVVIGDGNEKAIPSDQGIIDNYRDRSAKLCYDIDEKCHEKMNDCQKCTWGSYEVIDYLCPRGGRRYCGQNNCGERLQPACIRSKKKIVGDNAPVCRNDSPYGYCKTGLRTFCDENKVLVCI